MLTQMSMNYEYRYFYDVLAVTAGRFPDRVSFFRRSTENGSSEFQGRNFKVIQELTDRLIAGLIERADLAIGDRVLYLCDASVNWFIGDVAIVSAGGVCVPRGTDVTDEDIKYIVTHSECKYAIVQREKDKVRLEALRSREALTSLEYIYTLEDEQAAILSGENTVGELIEVGRQALEDDPSLVQLRLSQTDPDALATLIYTSGTTGAPKGVMLNQTGWIHCIQKVAYRVSFSDEERLVSLLPPWHAFERALEYAVVMYGLEFLVSDPVNLRDDLFEFKPTIFPSVPRIWETVYNGIITKLKKESPGKRKVFYFFVSVGAAWARHHGVVFNYDRQVVKPGPLTQTLRRIFSSLVLLGLAPLKLISKIIFAKIHGALGGNLRMSVTGGSALPQVVDQFLSAIGITVCEGYGMTETSAVVSIRHSSRPTPGTVGTPVEGYELRLKDERGLDVTATPGVRGVLWVKSKQIMMGYYKRPELNDVVFDKDGFFDTGDLMTLNWRGEIMFTGRAKDTIALGGGENIEPVPIEDRLLTSEFIDQVMVVGDDRKTLGALIVPNFDRVKDFVGEAGEDYREWNTNSAIRGLFRKEIGSLINRETGFKSFEIVPGNSFYIVPRNFDPDLEMTRTLKMKRVVIKEHFANEIDKLYK